MKDLLETIWAFNCIVWQGILFCVLFFAVLAVPAAIIAAIVEWLR